MVVVAVVLLLLSLLSLLVVLLLLLSLFCWGGLGGPGWEASVCGAMKDITLHCVSVQSGLPLVRYSAVHNVTWQYRSAQDIA